MLVRNGWPKQVRANIEAIRIGNASCSSDSDCTTVMLANNCIGFGQCPVLPSIARGQESSYRSAIASDIQAYCEQSQCYTQPSCLALQTYPACVSGRCETFIK